MRYDENDSSKSRELGASYATKIVFRPSVVNLVLGILLCMCIMPGLFGIAFLLFPGDGSFCTADLFPVIMCIIMTVVIGGLGLICIRSYLVSGRLLRGALDQYGEENLRHSIRHTTEWLFKAPFGSSVCFFTDKFVIDSSQAVFHYDDISMMAKDVLHTKTRIVRIIFYLVNGQKFYLCNNIRDKEIDTVMELCQKHNPDILLGHSKSNETVHKGRVELFRQGRYNPASKHTYADTDAYGRPQGFDSSSYTDSGRGFGEATNSSGDAFGEVTKSSGDAFGEAANSSGDGFGTYKAPYALTSEGKKSVSKRLLLIVGVTFLVTALGLGMGLYNIIVREVESGQGQASEMLAGVDEKQREAMLADGYTEYRTEGSLVERIETGEAVHSDKGWVGRPPIFIYSVEGEPSRYIGIESSVSTYRSLPSTAAGFCIFYNGNAKTETFAGKLQTYEVTLLKQQNIYQSFEIPTIEASAEKVFRLSFQTIVLFTCMVVIVMIGIIFIIIGMTGKLRKQA